MNKATPKVLIVDDDPDLLEMYEEVLSIEGVQILKATSGQKALEIFQAQQDIQVIISDSNMGSMCGMELLINLRSCYKTLPVFYLLTGAFDVTEAEVIDAGGSGLILKPFDLDEILERIKKDIKF
ncbi:MAG: response regulator [Bacteriovorax sp.]|nr:response regulator [Bacteriovorax sp.]